MASSHQPSLMVPIMFHIINKSTVNFLISLGNFSIVLKVHKSLIIIKLCYLYTFSICPLSVTFLPLQIPSLTGVSGHTNTKFVNWFLAKPFESACLSKQSNFFLFFVYFLKLFQPWVFNNFLLSAYSVQVMESSQVSLSSSHRTLTL